MTSLIMMLHRLGVRQYLKDGIICIDEGTFSDGAREFLREFHREHNLTHKGYNDMDRAFLTVFVSGAWKEAN